MTPFQAFYLYLTLFVFAVGWLAGSHTERRGVVSLMIAMIASVLFQDVGTDRVRWAVTLIDLILLIYLVWMSLKFDRWWLMVAGAAQLLAMVAHAGMFLDPDISLRVNVATRWVFGVVVVLALGGGVLERWLARERSVFLTWIRQQFKRPA